VSGTVGCVLVLQAFKYRIAMPRALESAACSHLGGSRFAHNRLLSLVKANWDPIRAEKEASGDGTHATEYLSTTQFGLLYLWQDVRGYAAPWWADNSAQRTTTRPNVSPRRSRTGVPVVPSSRATGKQHAESVKFSGNTSKIVDRHHIKLSRIGTVQTYESTRNLARRVEAGTARVITSLAAEITTQNRRRARRVSFHVSPEPSTRCQLSTTR
jgi:putative transposase